MSKAALAGSPVVRSVVQMVVFAVMLSAISDRTAGATTTVTVNNTNQLVAPFLPSAVAGSQVGNSPAWTAGDMVLGLTTFTEGLEVLTPAAAVDLNYATQRTKRITLGQDTVLTPINIPSASTNIETMLVEVIGNGVWTLAFNSVTFQTPLLSTPPAGVVTFYGLRADSGLVRGYCDPTVTFPGGLQGPLTPPNIPMATTTTNLTDSFLSQPSGVDLTDTRVSTGTNIVLNIASAQVLTNGDFLLRIQNSSSTRFSVAADSGYDGTGSNFLSDDGTYKPATFTGDAVWINQAGVVSLVPGNTNYVVNIVSQSTDNSTNIALRVDSPFWSGGGKQLVLANGGTNFLYGYDTGVYSVLSVYRDQGAVESFVDITAGTPANIYSSIDMFATPDSGTHKGAFSLSADGSAGATLLTGHGTEDADGTYSEFRLQADVTTLGLFLDHSGTLVTSLSPLISDGVAPYYLDTSLVHTTGNLMEVNNSGTNVVTVGIDNATVNGFLNATNYLKTSKTAGGYFGFVASGASSLGGNTGHVGLFANTGLATANWIAYRDDTPFYGFAEDNIVVFPNQTVVVNGDVLPASTTNTHNLGTTLNGWTNLYLNSTIVWNGSTNSLKDTWSSGSPESVLTSRPGTIDRDAANGVVYVKTTGTGNTGYGAQIGANGVQAGDPGGGAGLWKLGTIQTVGSVTISATNYVEISIGGTVAKLAVVQ